MPKSKRVRPDSRENSSFVSNGDAAVEPPTAKRHKKSVVKRGDVPEVHSTGTVSEVIATVGAGPTGDDAGLASRFSKLFGGGGSSSFFGSAAGPDFSAKTAPADGAPLTGRVEKPREASTSIDAASTQIPADGTLTTETVSDEPPKEKKKKVKTPLTEEGKTERETKTLFVGNVPAAWDMHQFRRYLRTLLQEKYTGVMKPIWFRSVPVDKKWSFQPHMRRAGSIIGAHATGTSDAKNAYVVLESAEAVRTVRFAVHGIKADDFHILKADGVGAASSSQFDHKRSVFVGNLPYSTTENLLRAALGAAGEIDTVRVVRDKVSQECKGFAFVRFKERAGVKAAINLWGAKVLGREIRITKVERPDDDDDASKQKVDAADESHPAARRIQSKVASDRWHVPTEEKPKAKPNKVRKASDEKSPKKAR